MKINILTQPLHINYGGILQNYALQQALRAMGHEPLTVNVPAKPPVRDSRLKDAVKTVINLVRKGCGHYPHAYVNPWKMRRKEWEGSRAQHAFAREHINTVDAAGPFDGEICQKYPADAWIVGSDQVWRPWCSPHIANCFLDFVPDTPQVRRIAYAASLGTDTWAIDPALTRRVKPLAKRFDAVSVREASAMALCREYLGIEPQMTLDPTLLLQAADYRRLLRGAEPPGHAYICAYILDSTSEKRKAVRAAARLQDIPVRQTGVLRKEGFDKVKEWIGAFAGASMVITDSFHGAVFSIIFRRPFSILGNDVRGNTRLDSLLGSLGLRTDSDGFYRVRLENEESLNALREKSLDFLKNALR